MMTQKSKLLTLILLALLTSLAAASQPNILLIFTDDQRYDAMGCVSEIAKTPNLDRLASRGVRFDQAFVTLSICSPSRAAVLTGNYGSKNGVTQLSKPLRQPQNAFPHKLQKAGYQTVVVGKWHLGSSPKQCGFDVADIFHSNGRYYGRSVTENGTKKKVEGYLEDWIAQRSITRIRQASQEKRPFFLWLCTQVPHMNHRFDWNVQKETLTQFPLEKMWLPATWQDDLSGKPAYLRTSRSRQRAKEMYGYDKPENIRRHCQRYLAAVYEMDRSLGEVLDALEELDLNDETWILFCGDNGWMLGEHGFTSKMLAYEPSMRVPMIIVGPKTKERVDKEHLVLNIDLPPTILALAGLPQKENAMDGRSLLPLLLANKGGASQQWRDAIFYEAPTPVLGSQPFTAIRTDRWKLIQTQLPDGKFFEELYDLQDDPLEINNLAKTRKEQTEALRTLLERAQKE